MAVRALFTWAVDVKKIRLRNPVKEVHIVTPTRIGRREWLDKESVTRVLTSAPDDEKNSFFYAASILDCVGGEIVEARVNWFDLNAGLLHIRKSPTFEPKDKDERTIPLINRFHSFIKEFLVNRPPKEWVLRPNVEKGKHRYRWDFRRPYTDFMASLDLRWVTPHIMRHSFASNLATAGISIFKISEWLGDDVRVVQRTYAKLAPADGDIQVLN